MVGKCCFLLLFLITISGCTSDPVSSEYKDIFSIYLVKDSNQFYSGEKPELKDFILEKVPLLTINSIESYDWNNHLIYFSSETKEELKKREPLLHYLFVVVANDERIYWGMFNDYADSYACINPTIFLIPRNPPMSSIPDIFHISCSDIADEADSVMRGDMRIYNALNNAGKLIK